MTPPRPCPPGWHDWEIALEDERMAQMYGWTLDMIDGLDEAARERVRYWWAVRAIHTEAERFLASWRKQNAGVLGRVQSMFGGKS